jgi:predicted nucleic acid-binding protein
MNLTQIPDGEWVVIDTNILIYANQGQSADCIEFLRLCASGVLHGLVPLPMVAELVHTLMLIEARENKWIDRQNPSRALAARPDLVRRLIRYETQVREFFGMGLRIEPALAADILEAIRIQREAGLLTNDALLLAVARRRNCTTIASADKAMASAPGFNVYAPSDVNQ